MSSLNASPSFSPQALRLWQTGKAALWSLFVLLVAVLVYVTWALHTYVWAFLLLPVSMLVVPLLLAAPNRFLLITLAGFVTIISYDEGIQLSEVAYGLFFLFYLFTWYASHLYLQRRSLLKTSTDWAIALYLCYIFTSISWGLLFGAQLTVIFGEILIFILMAFYFPIRDYCARDPKHVRNIVYVVCWFALFVSVRNLIDYRQGLSSAEILEEIISGRVALNEVLLMMPALGAMTFLIYARQWKERLIVAGLFILFFGSLIITQSRGYWMAFFLGALALFVLTDTRRKFRILIFFLSGLAGFLLIGYLLFPEYVTLISAGLIDRFASLGTALTSDISLVNRFHESTAVWEYIRVNPVIGYGMGTPYSYFNIITDNTREWSFIHNGYLGIWFKFGLIGLSLLMYFWARSIVTGIRLFYRREASLFLRIAVLAATVSLIAELLVANTSTPFQIADATLMITLLAAVISGCEKLLARSPSGRDA